MYRAVFQRQSRTDGRILKEPLSKKPAIGLYENSDQATEPLIVDGSRLTCCVVPSLRVMCKEIPPICEFLSGKIFAPILDAAFVVRADRLRLSSPGLCRRVFPIDSQSMTHEVYETWSN